MRRLARAEQAVEDRPIACAMAGATAEQSRKRLIWRERVKRCTGLTSGTGLTNGRTPWMGVFQHTVGKAGVWKCTLRHPLALSVASLPRHPVDQPFPAGLGTRAWTWRNPPLNPGVRSAAAALPPPAASARSWRSKTGSGALPGLAGRTQTQELLQRPSPRTAIR